MEQMLWLLAGGIPSLLVGIVLAKMKRDSDRAAIREAEKEERELLILECQDANFSITKELVDCVLYGKEPNGELEEAYKYKQDTKHKLEDYLRRRAAKN